MSKQHFYAARAFLEHPQDTVTCTTRGSQDLSEKTVTEEVGAHHTSAITTVSRATRMAEFKQCEHMGGYLNPKLLHQLEGHDHIGLRNQLVCDPDVDSRAGTVCKWGGH
jgi:hypothetical protein